VRACFNVAHGKVTGRCRETLWWGEDGIGWHLLFAWRVLTPQNPGMKQHCNVSALGGLAEREWGLAQVPDFKILNKPAC
jgi:hypothetical protein